MIEVDFSVLVIVALVFLLAGVVIGVIISRPAYYR